MKKILLLIILVLLVGFGGIYVYTEKIRKTSMSVPTENTLPVSGTVTENQNGKEVNITLKTPNGAEIVVANFLASAYTKKDPENPGYYTLGSQVSNATPYLITYIEATSYFNIVLVQEPLGQSRVQAENYLQNTLRITREQMCSIDYTLSVPNSVNTIYSGTNLGFSFCPGAVTLP